MKSIIGLRTVLYFVPDISAAKKWYSDSFGIEPYFDEPYYVGYEIGGYELGLHPIEKQQGGMSGVIAYWAVDNVHEMYHKLINDHGAKSNEEPTDVGGGIIIASVNDPWGNPIGIIHNPHFKLE
jgi:lactoylglutathione lyase